VKVLGIDTSTLTAGIALVDGDRVLAEAKTLGGARSADVLVTIDDVCKRANTGPFELDAVAVGAGPGSFTGLRIGMATAKGIAFAAQKPLWAVSSLAALAFDAAAPLVCAAMDARRSEVFAGLYRDRVLVDVERVLAPAALAAWIASLTDEPVQYAGDAIDVYATELAALAPAWLAPRTPSGIAVARLALSGARVDIVTSGSPSYIRPSEAEVMYPDGVPGAIRRP
jgi:tRNA threonylcarbamoyladenosine biosynthesis protein TsaB